MKLTNLLELLSGLGCFLFGMKYMGDGLQSAAGPKMREMLEKLTRNKVMGFLLGMFVTCAIQSSAATTVMVMGFLNASMMDLAQATGVIFGANLGTTVTSILIALDVSAISPICIFIGTLMILYGKKSDTKRIGQVILGFGILFMGLHTMSSAMAFLRTNEAFQSFIVRANNPLLGLLIGILMAAIIQSSSAAVGIVQALALQGLMPLQFACFLVCGINIGSSVPPILSAISARNNAKRAAVIYTIFNIVGALIIMPLAMFTPYISWIASVVEAPAFQVSLLHILFKVLTAIILLPLTNKVVNLTYRIVPKEEHESEFRLQYIDKNLKGEPEVSVLQITKEVERMINLVNRNLTDTTACMFENKIDKAEEVQERENLINYLNQEITKYVASLSKYILHSKTVKYTTRVIHVVADLERVSDYCVHLTSRMQILAEEKVELVPEASMEVSHLFAKACKVFREATKSFLDGNATQETLDSIENQYMQIHKLRYLYEDNHVYRLQNDVSQPEGGLVFVKFLNYIERIAEHGYQISKVSDYGADIVQ